jgi:hypothetical protein
MPVVYCTDSCDAPQQQQYVETHLLFVFDLALGALHALISHTACVPLGSPTLGK